MMLKWRLSVSRGQNFQVVVEAGGQSGYATYVARLDVSVDRAKFPA
jgi:hypothetical protein